MGEGGGGAEGELEGGFEEVAAEDHEVVPVAVLGLHDLRGGEGGGGHVVGVWGFAEGVVGVYADGLSVGVRRDGGERGGRRVCGRCTVVVELAEPHCVNEVALLVVGCLLSQAGFRSGFFRVVVLLS